MILILYSQCLTIVSLWAILKYKEYFTNLFWLVSTGVLIAFIPNFITSLYINIQGISAIESEIYFSITGGIVLLFLWKILSPYGL